jgi:hypothetical protein
MSDLYRQRLAELADNDLGQFSATLTRRAKAQRKVRKKAARKAARRAAVDLTLRSDIDRAILARYRRESDADR